MHQSASQPGSDVQLSTEHTGKGISASQHLPSSQLRSDRQDSRSFSSRRTGTDSSAKHQSTSQLKSDQHRPRSSSPHLLPNRSQPASLIQTGTDLVPTLLPPDMYLSARHIPTVPNLHWPPTPAHLHCTDRDRTVFLV